MSKIQSKAEVVEEMLLDDLAGLRFTDEETNALNNILYHLSVTGEYTLPEHLKVVK